MPSKKVAGNDQMGVNAHHQLYHEAKTWLEFNHRVGGIIVVTLAGLTWLELREVRPSLLIRLSWPSCLMLLGGYNLLWSDKPAWPIGPSGLVDSLSNSESCNIKFWPSSC